MASDERITLSRDVEAIEIPSGFPLTLEAGKEVRITQALGGSYTVTTWFGGMARISGRDADALGKQGAAADAAARDRPLQEQVWEELKQVFDPEIPVNIVDLGLIYACTFTPLEHGRTKVGIAMTLTAPGCGMGDVLRADVQRRLTDLPGVDAEVELVLDPPWDQSRMSEAARLQLGM
ncbi:MAG: putative Fe-S cluster assembly protein SufT [Myxococcaceae bacterium]